MERRIYYGKGNHKVLIDYDLWKIEWCIRVDEYEVTLKKLELERTRPTPYRFFNARTARKNSQSISDLRERTPHLKLLPVHYNVIVLHCNTVTSTPGV